MPLAGVVAVFQGTRCWMVVSARSILSLYSPYRLQRSQLPDLWFNPSPDAPNRTSDLASSGPDYPHHSDLRHSQHNPRPEQSGTMSRSHSPDPPRLAERGFPWRLRQQQYGRHWSVLGNPFVKDRVRLWKTTKMGSTPTFTRINWTMV